MDKELTYLKNTEQQFRLIEKALLKAKEEGRTKIMMNDLSIMEDNDPSENYKSK